MAENDVTSILEQLLNPTVDLGGAPRPDDVKAIAQLIMGGGRASLGGVPLFGGGGAGAPPSTPNTVPLGPDDTSAAINAYSREKGYAVQPVAAPIATPVARRPSPIRPALQDILNTADQMASSLRGQPEQVTKTLLPNPYGPGSYNPNDPGDIARINKAGEDRAKLDRARQFLTSDFLTKLPPGAPTKEIIAQVFESLGITKTAEEKAKSLAKARAEGTALGHVGGVIERTETGTLADKVAEATARNIAAGKVDPPTGRAAAEPRSQDIMARALEIDPEWSIQRHNARKALAKDLATGQKSKDQTALNTVVGHLSDLKKTVEALGPSDSPIWNSIKNTGLTQSGDPRVRNLEKVSTAVVSELAKVFKGQGSATDQEIEAWREQFQASDSKQTLLDGIKVATKLMASRAHSIEDLVTNIMGTPMKGGILFPSSRTILKNMGLEADYAGETSPVSKFPPRIRVNPVTGRTEIWKD